MNCLETPNVKSRAISSQADQEWSEGSTTRSNSPERTMKAHERAAKRIYTPEQKAAKKAYKEARKEHYAMLNAKYREQHKDELRAYMREWKRNNRERVSALNASYRERHKERLLAKSRAESAALISKRLERRRNDAAYLAKHNAARALRRASLQRATPVWADSAAINTFYVEAQSVSKQSGIKHHVDHVVPLVNPLVCGLHVPENLRVVPAVVNMSKQNKFLIDEIV